MRKFNDSPPFTSLIFSFFRYLAYVRDSSDIEVVIRSPDISKPMYFGPSWAASKFHCFADRRLCLSNGNHINSPEEIWEKVVVWSKCCIIYRNTKNDQAFSQLKHG